MDPDPRHDHHEQHASVTLGPPQPTAIETPRSKRPSNKRTNAAVLSQIEELYRQAKNGNALVTIGQNGEEVRLRQGSIRYMSQKLGISRSRVRGAIQRLKETGTVAYGKVGMHNKRRRALNDEHERILKSHLEDRVLKRQRVDYKYVKEYMCTLPGVQPGWTPSQGFVAKTLKKINFRTRSQAGRGKNRLPRSAPRSDSMVPMDPRPAAAANGSQLLPDLSSDMRANALMRLPDGASSARVASVGDMSAGLARGMGSAATIVPASSNLAVAVSIQPRDAVVASRTMVPGPLVTNVTTHAPAPTGHAPIMETAQLFPDPHPHPHHMRPHHETPLRQDGMVPAAIAAAAAAAAVRVRNEEQVV